MNTDNVKRFSVVDPGHTYDLFALAKDGAYDVEGLQTLKFIKKEAKTEDGELVTVQEGTTTEAVLGVLIDRLEFVQGALPDDFTKRAIDNLQAAFKELLDRRADRASRGVLGTTKP